jgi:hypothetical protein
MTVLAKKEISDSPRRMGRPRLDKANEAVMVPVRFTPATLARILKAAGANRRAEFIREAVEEKLTAVEAELHRRKP